MYDQRTLKFRGDQRLAVERAAKSLSVVEFLEWPREISQRSAKISKKNAHFSNEFFMT